MVKIEYEIIKYLFIKDLFYKIKKMLRKLILSIYDERLIYGNVNQKTYEVSYPSC